MAEETTAVPVIRAGENMPESGPCYIMAKDGYYVKKTNRLFEAVVRSAEIPGLGIVAESLRWTGPRIPMRLIDECAGFFRAVYREHSSEAVVLLELKGGEWSLAVPEQEVSGASVKYDTPKGVTPVGSVHSHCAMPAFQSGTDAADTAGFDGVHIVLGRIERSEPEIEAGVAVNGRLFRCDPATVIDGLDGRHTEAPHPWIAKVRAKPARVWADRPEFPPHDAGRERRRKSLESEMPEFCPVCMEEMVRFCPGGGYCPNCGNGIPDELF